MVAHSEVPLLDLTAQYRSIQAEVEPILLELCRSQRFILGPEVQGLEEEFANYCGARFAVGLSSGTDALIVALMSLGVQSGDEVVTSPFSFFATASSIARIGARPVFVDIDPISFNLNVDHVERAITKKTRAIMPVHLFGQCVSMDGIRDLAARHGVAIVEDACQAVGAKFDGQAAGSLGTIGCFSFFPSKNLGGFGDGGIATTDDEGLYQKMKTLRTHGEVERYHHSYLGGNFRLDAIQAAVLRIKLRHLDLWTASRRHNADRYRIALADLCGVGGSNPALSANAPLALPAELSCCFHVYNQYVVRCLNRDGLSRHLGERKIGTAIYYPIPLHLQRCFAYLGYKPGDFPISEQAAAQVLALPIFAELTVDQQQRVCDEILSFYRK